MALKCGQNGVTDHREALNSWCIENMELWFAFWKIKEEGRLRWTVSRQLVLQMLRVLGSVLVTKLLYNQCGENED